MRILLTGGSGSVGKAVVDRLARNGFSVLVIGRREGVSFEGADYTACDVTDFPRLREVIRGCEAVVHLAAIPNPSGGTSPDVFQANAQGTFNVFQAAAEEGIRRVVQASSINATGQFYGIKPAPLNYLPIDEEHPLFSTDIYSFSKLVIEEIGAYYWRREGISSVALRLPWVAPAGQHEVIDQRRVPVQKTVEMLLPLSTAERRAWFDKAWANYNTFRATRPYEQPGGQVRQRIMAMPEEERLPLMAMSNRVNFYTWVDERDSAQAIEKGLTADYEGAHPLFINDCANWTGIESQTLVDLFYPDVPELKKPLSGHDTLVSIDQARALVGFEPEFSFE